jgi:hypothetical protein
MEAQKGRVWAFVVVIDSPTERGALAHTKEGG